MRSESVEGGTWLVYILHMRSHRGCAIPQNSLSDFLFLQVWEDFQDCAVTATPRPLLGLVSNQYLWGFMHAHTDHKLAGWDRS